jgi:hypothetical protein
LPPTGHLLLGKNLVENNTSATFLAIVGVFHEGFCYNEFMDCRIIRLERQV